jgi:hypothetical protein
MTDPIKVLLLDQSLPGAPDIPVPPQVIVGRYYWVTFERYDGYGERECLLMKLVALQDKGEGRMGPVWMPAGEKTMPGNIRQIRVEDIDE